MTQPEIETANTQDDNIETVSDGFNLVKAEAAYDAAMAAAIKTAEAEKSVNSLRRALCMTVYHFITEVMPLPELAKLKQRLSTAKPGIRIVLPIEIESYLRSKRLPLPHLNSLNPFLGIFQHFYQCARVELQITSRERADAIIKKANDPNAENVMVSRYAKLILCAVDREDETLIFKPMGKTFKEYNEWRMLNPTLSLRDSSKPPSTSSKLTRQNADELRAVQSDEAGVSATASDDDVASLRSLLAAGVETVQGDAIPPTAIDIELGDTAPAGQDADDAAIIDRLDETVSLHTDASKSIVQEKTVTATEQTFAEPVKIAISKTIRASLPPTGYIRYEIDGQGNVLIYGFSKNAGDQKILHDVRLTEPPPEPGATPAAKKPLSDARRRVMVKQNEKRRAERAAG